MATNMESSVIRIFLVRHGETDWNRARRFQGRSDIPLNEEGKNQARALALALKGEIFTALYTSPLLRAYETARLIGVFHPSAPLFTEAGLMEMDLGDFEGMEGRHWAEQYPDLRKSWQENPASVKIPGGESLAEVQARALEALGRILQPYHQDSCSLLICSHNFVTLTILCHTLGIPLNRFRELRQETAAFSILCRQGNRFYAEVVNERSHLQT